MYSVCASVSFIFCLFSNVSSFIFQQFILWTRLFLYLCTLWSVGVFWVFLLHFQRVFMLFVLFPASDASRRDSGWPRTPSTGIACKHLGYADQFARRMFAHLCTTYLCWLGSQLVVLFSVLTYCMCANCRMSPLIAHCSLQTLDILDYFCR